MRFNSEVAKIPQAMLSPDLAKVHELAELLIKAGLCILRFVHHNESKVWIPRVLELAGSVGQHLKDFRSGTSDLTDSLLAEFATLERPISVFGVTAPSTHEWTPLFAEKVLQEMWVGMSPSRKATRVPMQMFFSGRSRNPLEFGRRSKSGKGVPVLLELNAQAIEKHIRGLDLPDEQLLNSNLKTEACLVASKRQPKKLDRLVFDDDSRCVTVDEKSYKEVDPIAYAFFRAIAEARPGSITSRGVESKTKFKSKRFSRELDKLPAGLRKLIRTNTTGHSIVLPRRKLS